MTRLSSGLGLSALVLLVACGTAADGAGAGGAAGGETSSSSTASASASASSTTGGAEGGGPPCAGPAVCPVVGDAIAFGSDVAWSFEVDGAPPEVGDRHPDARLFSDDAAGGWVLHVGDSPTSSCLATGTIRVDAARTATQLAVPLSADPNSANAYAAAPSSAGMLYALDDFAVRLVGADGRDLWSKPRDREGSQLVAGAGGVAVYGLTTVEAWAPDGTPRFSKSSPTAACVPAHGLPICASNLNGATVLPDGAVALSGYSADTAPYDFGGGPLSGPFLVVLEPGGDVRVAKTAANVGTLSVNNAGQIVLLSNSEPYFTFALGRNHDVLIYDDHGNYLQGASAHGAQLQGTDATGAVLWERTATLNASAMLVAGDHALLVDMGGHFLVFDVKTGAVERDAQVTLPADGMPTAHQQSGLAEVALARDGSAAFVAWSRPACAHQCFEGKKSPVGHAYLAGFGPLHCTP